MSEVVGSGCVFDGDEVFGEEEDAETVVEDWEGEVGVSY